METMKQGLSLSLLCLSVRCAVVFGDSLSSERRVKKESPHTQHCLRDKDKRTAIHTKTPVASQ